MDPSVFAAVGGVVIGLIAGTAASFRSTRHARPGAERRYVLHVVRSVHAGAHVVPGRGVPRTPAHDVAVRGADAGPRCPGGLRGESLPDRVPHSSAPRRR